MVNGVDSSCQHRPSDLESRKEGEHTVFREKKNDRNLAAPNALNEVMHLAWCVQVTMQEK